MTNAEAIAIIRKEYLCVDRDCDIEKNCGRCDLMMPSKEPILEAYKMAIQALEQEPCEDAISRQAVLEQTYNWSKDEFLRVTNPFDYLRKRINSLSPVKPQEPKTGHWIAYEVRLPDRTILNYRCSVCGRKLIGYNTETLSEAPYCHCGAKMEVEQHG